MPQFDDASIPLKVPAALAEPPKSSPNPPQRGSKSFMNIAIAGLVTAVVCIACWASWSYLHSSSKVDDYEAIADMDGFEPLPSREKEKIDLDASPGFQLEVPSADGTSFREAPGVPELPANLFTESEPSSSAEVWLTGTIEDSDSPGEVKRPVRLSREPRSSTLR